MPWWLRRNKKLACRCPNRVPSIGRMEGDGSLNGRKLALLATGSFNPPNYAHLRIFERARDYLERVQGANVLVGYMSAISDGSGVLELPPAKHRLRMIELALKKNEWIRLEDILLHYEKMARSEFGDDVLLILLCGGDMLETREATFNSLRLMSDNLEHLVENHRMLVVSRPGSDPSRSVYVVDALRRNEANIHIIDDETFPNDLSSTRIRTAIRRGENVRYSLPDKVIHYINHHRLYTSNTLQRQIILKDIERVFSSSTVPTHPPLPSPPSRPIPPPIPPPPKRSTAVKPTNLFMPRMSQSMHSGMCATTSFESTPQADVWESSTQSQESPILDTPPKPPTPQKIVTPEHRMTQSLVEHSSPSKLSPTLTAGAALAVGRCELPYKSPDYDNVTLDELLEASNGWANYMNEQYKALQNRPCVSKIEREHEKEKTEKSSSCSPSKGPKSLLKPFLRSNSKTANEVNKNEKKCNCAQLYSQDFYGVHEILKDRRCECGSYLGSVPTLSNYDDPRLSSIRNDRNRYGNGVIEPPPRVSTTQSNATESDRIENKKRIDRKTSREQRSIRFASDITKSMDSIPNMKVNHVPPSDPMTQSVAMNGFANDDNQVTLSFTRYRLSSTPETTV